VLAAIVGTVFYAKAPSFYKVCCLPIIVGGVAFASLKKGEDGSYSLKFDTTALVFGMLANSFAAFKGGENSKLMADKGIAQRYGGVGNQVSAVKGVCLKRPLSFYVIRDSFNHFLETLSVCCNANSRIFNPSSHHVCH